MKKKKIDNLFLHITQNYKTARQVLIASNIFLSDITKIIRQVLIVKQHISNHINVTPATAHTSTKPKSTTV